MWSKNFGEYCRTTGLEKLANLTGVSASKIFSDRYQEAMERALSCSRNVAWARGPEEGGGDPRVRGPGEDSTSEDGGRYGAVLLASVSLWKGLAWRGS